MSNLRSRYRTFRAGVALLAAGGGVALACSSTDTTNSGGSAGQAANTGGTTSAAGASAKAGTGASGGSTSAGSGGTSTMTTGGTGTSSGGSGVSGSAGTSTSVGAGAGGMTSVAGAGGTTTAGAPGGGAPSAGSGNVNGGAPSAAGTSGSSTAGAAGTHAGGAGGTGGSSTASFTCNEIIGIDSTSEWYTSGFETYVPDGKWQLLSYHPGYVEDWGNASDAVWSMATLTSPCTTNSDNPDRVIYNMFADGSDSSITNETAFAAGLAKVITQIKAHYSRVKRIDLLTMTRAPMNVACSSSNAAGSMIPQYFDDAVTMEVAAGPPQIIASPPFFAPDCTVFDDTGGPHFSDAGKPIIAKLYGQYYAAEP